MSASTSASTSQPVAPNPAGAYFVALGDARYRPSELTSGAWTPTEQHVSPLNGLVVHAMERFAAARGAGDHLVLARLTFDILGVVAVEDFDIEVEVVRPGRTIELLEAMVIARGRPVLRARGWRLVRQDTAAVAGGGSPRLPPPDGLALRPLSDVWPGGYVASVEVRPIAEPEPGRATAWVSTDVALVANEPVSDLARYVGLVDTANGVAVRQSPDAWMFPNVDLSVHLHRQPVGALVGLDVTVVFGPDGQGLTSTVLHDLRGPVGRAEQILTVRPRS